ncbi:hypothetical protein GC176_13480 [bacterium]|nr:hypothetical protein [bacterium]
MRTLHFPHYSTDSRKKGSQQAEAGSSVLPHLFVEARSAISGLATTIDEMIMVVLFAVGNAIGAAAAAIIGILLVVAGGCGIVLASSALTLAIGSVFSFLHLV